MAHSVSQSVVVPLVLWGKSSPTHSISSILVSRNHSTIVTGTSQGQICLWDFDLSSLESKPKCLMLGHTAAITCLVRGSINVDLTNVISASANGEMCSWDLVTGQCLESVKLPYVHTYIQAHHVSSGDYIRLFCIGKYSDILIMDPMTLEISATLTSRYHTDWYSAIHVLKPARRPDDVVLAVTIRGVVRVWTLGGHELKNNETVTENESKQVDCINPVSMTCCVYNQRTVLLVSAQCWQIYDAGDFSLLSSNPAKDGEQWMGGDFIASDRVIIWSSKGRTFMFKLPTNCIVENKNFHNKATDGELPFLYCILGAPSIEPLSQRPAFHYCMVSRDGKVSRWLTRGDANGNIGSWPIPEVSDNQLEQIQQVEFKTPPEVPPSSLSSLKKAWSQLDNQPLGILSQLDETGEANPNITSSLFITNQGKLACGREDGSIAILQGTPTVMLLLLLRQHPVHKGFPPLLVMKGHRGRVTCLLYPHQFSNRYDSSYLMSGGVDFSTCLWDLHTGALLHRFCVQAGEITQLIVPPPNCSQRVLSSICSIAGDHSAAILNLKERKLVLLASRHVYPISTIKWRPLDDFMMVRCTDGSVYVWQMETGQLDRLVQGMVAEELMNACDENSVLVDVSDSGLANPAVHFFRGLRHRNLAAIRHAAQRGLHELQKLQGGNTGESNENYKIRGSAMSIQGLKMAPKDPESHVIFFDVEALIVQLLTEDYNTMTPHFLEAKGLTNNSEHQRIVSLTRSASPDASKKIAGILAKVKEGAENMQVLIQAKADTVGFKVAAPSPSPSRKGSDGTSEGINLRRPHSISYECRYALEVGELLLSLLHAWGVDYELDQICQTQLGLLKPVIPISFGLLSKTGQLVLVLPTAIPQIASVSSKNVANLKVNPFVSQVPTIETFTSKIRWELFSALTTNHLLSIVSLANTMMSVHMTSFWETRTSVRSTRNRSDSESERVEEMQSKQAWSLMATLHCVLLPERIKSQTTASDYGIGAKQILMLRPEGGYRQTLVEVLARRWQDRCLEIREAAQALLLAELTRLGARGRKELLDVWAPFLPIYSDAFATSALQTGATNGASAVGSGQVPVGSTVSLEAGQTPITAYPQSNEDEELEDPEDEEESANRKPSRSAELRRRQATAIILLGVLGAEFGQDSESVRGRLDGASGGAIEGFGGSNYSLARATSKALTYLLLAPPTPKLPPHTPLRRAAVDLIGRGFTVWEPHLEVSRVLLSLLELCSEAEKLVPSMSYGLPLPPSADSSRTSRHALTLIATARPAVFITSMAKEVARYNSTQQNLQNPGSPMASLVLYFSRHEILRVVEQLIDKMPADISHLLVEVVDIILHCVDSSHLKVKGLQEVFPAVCRFSQVSHCASTRRIAVGAKNGHITVYELRGGKPQSIAAHNGEVTACSFSPDGKILASYSATDNRVAFWQQVSSGVFGLGSTQTKCMKVYSVNPIPEQLKSNPLKIGKLVWVSSKAVLLMLADGSEIRLTL
ncbi:WD repeat-containing protein 7-like isoform X2 [Artemia franciscana]|uniref:WD repeat-containing protein 7-like isoform X2 n=1 Tax=Artemia franciscana TaxID=6661 RepID=UPI0032DB85E2